jgi:hypothetical protein
MSAIIASGPSSFGSIELCGMRLTISVAHVMQVSLSCHAG